MGVVLTPGVDRLEAESSRPFPVDSVSDTIEERHERSSAGWIDFVQDICVGALELLEHVHRIRTQSVARRRETSGEIDGIVHALT